MRLLKFIQEGSPRLLLTTESRSILLAQEETLTRILAQAAPLSYLENIPGEDTLVPVGTPLPPVDDQEVWGCGVTYFNSRLARMTESKSSSSIYDQVYEAPRPAVFPKARGRDVIGSGRDLFLREDSRWMVPEPELVLVISAQGQIVGATIGNDFSCRDIEGLNPLYQPQAKIWSGSCAVGPCIDFTADLDSLSARQIEMRIHRGSGTVFTGKTNTSSIVRSLSLLVETMFKFRKYPDGAYLFTGTGIIPPDDFSLAIGDVTHITIEGIGELTNGASGKHEII